jgi:hypothetical protein
MNDIKPKSNPYIRLYTGKQFFDFSKSVSKMLHSEPGNSISTKEITLSPRDSSSQGNITTAIEAVGTKSIGYFKYVNIYFLHVHNIK